MNRLLALLVLLAPSSLYAATYMVVSENYFSVQGPVYTTAMRISGTFTTAQPLAPNLSQYNLASPASSNALLDWNFSDGAFTYTPSNSILDSDIFSVTTDSTGNPAALGFGFDSPKIVTVGQTLNDMAVVTGDGVGADAGVACLAATGGRCTSSDSSHASHAGVAPPAVTITRLPDPVGAPAGGPMTWFCLGMALIWLAERALAFRRCRPEDRN